MDDPSPQPAPKSRRRWFQFRLRTLFVFTAVVALIMGLCSGVVRQHRAVQAIRSLEPESRFIYDFETKRGAKRGEELPRPGSEWLRNALGDDWVNDMYGDVVHVIVGDSRFESHTHEPGKYQRSSLDDERLKHLAVEVRRLPKLREVDLIASDRVTDVGMGHLAEMAEPLAHLDLSETEVTDAGLSHLAGAVNLRKVWLRNTDVRGSGLIHLRAPPKLWGLDLAGSKLTDEGCAAIGTLEQLTVLEVSETQIGDSGLDIADEDLVHLAQLDNLRGLLLDGTSITDAGLVHVARIGSLRYLSLKGTQVTDAGLEHLVALPDGCEVFLFGTKVTAAGVKNLMEKRGDLYVASDVN